jgi:type IV fimbrial biogenesis protein FimT
MRTEGVRNPMHCPAMPEKRPYQRGAARGFTIVELMVTLAVFAVVVSLAAPSFTRMMLADRITAQTNELVMGLNAAKSEAIRRGQPVSLRARDDAYPNDFHRGWSTFTDANGDGVAEAPATPEDGTVVRDTLAAAGRTTVERVTRTGTSPAFTYDAATSSLNGRQFVTFNARGGIAGNGPAFFRICDSSNNSVPGRIVQVSIIGRVSLDNANLTACP